MTKEQLDGFAEMFAKWTRDDPMTPIINERIEKALMSPEEGTL